MFTNQRFIQYNFTLLNQLQELGQKDKDENKQNYLTHTHKQNDQIEK